MNNKYEQKDTLEGFYKQLERFQDDEKCENRVRLLIKNMFEDKDNGWKKAEDAEKKGPMKVEEFRKLETEKMRKKQQEADEFVEKDEQRGSKMYQKKDRKEEEKQEVILLSDKQIGDKALNCFKNFVQVVKQQNEQDRDEEEIEALIPDVGSFIDLFKLHGSKCEQVFLCFLNRLYDESNEIVHEYQRDFLEFLSKRLKREKLLDVNGITSGVSKFIQNAGDLEADVPKIATYFAATLVELLSLKMIDFEKLVWIRQLEGNDDFLMPDINYKILGHILKEVGKEQVKMSEVVRFYRVNRCFTILEKTLPHIQMDLEDIFADVEADLGEEFGEIII